MDHVAGSLVLVADCFLLADGQPGVQVDVAEQRHPVTIQDLRHRRLWQVQVVADAVWTPPAGEPQGDDAPFRAPRGLVRRRMWLGRAIGQADQAVRTIPADPFRDGGSRHLQALGDARLNPAVLHDQLDEFAAAFRRQQGVGMGNVRDEGLLASIECGNPTDTGGPHLFNSRHAHNLRGKNT